MLSIDEYAHKVCCEIRQPQSGHTGAHRVSSEIMAFSGLNRLVKETVQRHECWLAGHELPLKSKPNHIHPDVSGCSRLVGPYSSSLESKLPCNLCDLASSTGCSYHVTCQVGAQKGNSCATWDSPPELPAQLSCLVLFCINLNGMIQVAPLTEL